MGETWCQKRREYLNIHNELCDVSKKDSGAQILKMTNDLGELRGFTICYPFFESCKHETLVKSLTRVVAFHLTDPQNENERTFLVNALKAHADAKNTTLFGWMHASFLDLRKFYVSMGLEETTAHFPPGAYKFRDSQENWTCLWYPRAV